MKSLLKITLILLSLIMVLSLVACNGDPTPTTPNNNSSDTPHEHSYEANVVDPTKTKNGYTEYTCTLCNDSYVDNITYATGSEGLEYSVNQGGNSCTITGMGTCTDTDLYIPDYIDGRAVAGIEDRAFAGATEVKSIRLPSTLTDIKIEQLYSFSSARTVYYDAEISDHDHVEGSRFIRRAMSVESFEHVIFNGIKAPKYVCYDCDNIKKVTFGENVTLISIYSFAGCDGITEISIPANVTTVGYGAFSNCINLTSVTIAEGVKVLEGDTFSYCTGISEIELPESLERIGDHTFMGCTNLKSLTVPSKVEVVGIRLLWGCTSLTEINLPASIRAIDYEAFKDCTSLKTINFAGTMAEWEAIKKDEGWNESTGNYVINCSDGKINKS